MSFTNFTNDANYVIQLKKKLSSTFKSLFGKEEAGIDAVSLKVFLKGLFPLLEYKYSEFVLAVRQTRDTQGVDGKSTRPFSGSRHY